MNKWRKTHSGIEGEEMTATQLAEYKKIKAEPREARMEIDFRDKAAAFLRGGSPGKNTIRVHPSAKEGDHPGACVMCHCPGGVAFRLLRLAQQGHVRNPQSAVKNSPFL